MSNVVINNLAKMNINRADLIKTGFSAQKYDDVMRGRSNYKLDELIEISEKFQLSLDFLILGKEKNSSTELTADEQELLTYYNKLDLINKGKIIGRAEALSEVCSNNKSITVTGLSPTVPEEDTQPVYIEFYNLPASAGTGIYLDGCDKIMIGVTSTPLTEKANFALIVRGDSMKPKFSDGDYVLIRTQPCVDVDEIGIFILNDEGYIKKFGGDKLISLNPEYEDILINDYDDFCCRGKVLGILPEDCIIR